MNVAVGAPRLSGRIIIDGLHRAGIGFVVSVPDICTSDVLLAPLAVEPGLRLVRVCKEDEGVSICAALSFTSQRALLLMQQTGLLDSVNALRAIAVDYRNPVCMMIGLLGKEPDRAPRDSARLGVRIVVPVLEALAISHRLLDSDADVPDCVAAIDAAYANGTPLAILLGREPS